MDKQAAETNRGLRWVLGLVAAPLVPAMGVMYVVTRNHPSASPALFTFTAIVGYAAMLVFGLPVLLLLRMWFATGVKTCIAVGIWAGVATLMAFGGVLAMVDSGESFWEFVLTPELLGVAVGAGAAAGLALWAIVRPELGVRVAKRKAAKVQASEATT